MNKKNAEDLLNETFGHSYDVVQFLNFITELFNGFDVKQMEHLIPNAYRDYIDTEYYKQFGTYIDGSGNAIDVLAIKLKRTTSRDRARTMQRNFVAKHLSENNSHAALVAFYDDNPQDWRFSFVKLDYRLERDETGKVKSVEDLTPAKRYSYLVGVNEPNHTCRGQFLELIKNDKINPSIEELESAFSIEKVTKEFFDKYKELYLGLKEALEGVIKNDSQIKADFDEKEISTVDFAKKLLGQIVFLYFLQKKGWLGVEWDGITGKFNEWGSGHKKFLTELVHGRIVDYENRNGNPINFFNDILEPLFYQALATERDEDYYEIYDYKCKIPFLNGGLFEPINDYNWKETDILLDNSIFKTIIDTFDEFNFTVKEDEPLEKEVAVDPEMLGKVFENLLDVKDRRSKGAFYTPREIVHYMCQQSLINYLETNTKEKDISRSDIEEFIQFGDYSSSADQRYLMEIRKLEEKIKSGESTNVLNMGEQIQDKIEKLTLPKSIRFNKEIIDKLLSNIKVADPAVGSGAFPVGMMNEIVKARSILTIFFPYNNSSDRTDYKLKRETIQNCLYGVDIDSSAVDITKLRFWLSLIVDEDDRDNIEPLPNLDHKIMCGNSLLEEFEGVKLFNEKMLGEPIIDHSFEIGQIDSKMDELNEKLNRLYTGKTDDGDPKKIKKQISKLENEKKKILSAPKKKTQQLNLSDAQNFKMKQSVRKLRVFVALQKQFFDTQNKKGKDKLRAEMDNLEWELIEETLNEDGNEESIQKLQQYKKTKSKPFFLWKLHFAEVFQRENPGFDVVIGNPPYVSYGLRGGQKMTTEEKSILRTTFPNSAEYKISLYAIFMDKSIQISRPEGGIQTLIVPDSFLLGRYFSKIRNWIIKLNKIEYILLLPYRVFDATVGFSVIYLFQRKNKIDPLHNITAKLAKTNEDISKSNFKSFAYPQEYIEKMKYDRFRLFFDRTTMNLVSKIELNSIELVNFMKGRTGVRSLIGQKNIIGKSRESDTWQKGLISGSQILKYVVIYNEDYINIDPNLLNKGGWDYDVIHNEKLLLRQTGDHITAAIDYNGYYHLNNIHSFATNTNRLNILYLLAILNSNLLDYYYKNISLETNRAMAQTDIESLESLPIKEVSSLEQKAIINLVEQILNITKDSDYLDSPDKQSKVKALESQIDQLVYKLYDLTPEEIAIVENFNGGK